MYQVQILLQCTDINTITARNIALLPHKGQKIKCKVCGKEQVVIMVGKPYPLKEKKTS